MAHVGYISEPLDPEVEEILIRLVEEGLKVDRAHRRFFASRPLGTSPAYVVSGAGIQGRFAIAPQDLNELQSHGHIKTERHNTQGFFEFFVTRQGLAYYRQVNQRAEPLERVEDESVRYLDTSGFRERHREAYDKWKQAAVLRDEDPMAHASRVGHDCREAMMAFASSLAARHGVAVEAAPEQTVKKVRAVLDKRRGEASDKTQAFLHALLAYWGTVNDLAQRQEHAASREGKPLEADDARRAVFYTVLVMQELDRLDVLPGLRP